jgi:NADP-dependent 3-hydroxy acid dehydrogenase YdfG
VVANLRSIKQSEDPDLLSIAGDVAERNTASPIVASAIEQFGRIDTLINAGIVIAKPFVDFTSGFALKRSRSNL